MIEHNIFIKELSWQESIYEIAAVDPDLAKVIQLGESCDEYTAIKVCYPYGAKIIERGQLQLPMGNGTLMPLNHTAVAESIRKNLAYRF